MNHSHYAHGLITYIMIKLLLVYLLHKKTNKRLSGAPVDTPSRHSNYIYS